MAKEIPTYESNVSPDAGNPNVLIDPNKMTQGARGIAAVGQGIENVSESAEVALKRYQDKKDAVDMLAYENGFNKKLTDYMAKVSQIGGAEAANISKLDPSKFSDIGIDGQQGEVSITQHSGKYLPQMAIDYASNANPRVQPILQQKLLSMAGGRYSEVAHHEATETRKYIAFQLEEWKQNAVESLHNEPTKENLAKKIVEGEEYIKKLSPGNATEEITKLRTQLTQQTEASREDYKVSTVLGQLQRLYKSKDFFPENEGDPIKSNIALLSALEDPDERKRIMNEYKLTMHNIDRIRQEVSSAVSVGEKAYKAMADPLMSKFQEQVDSGTVKWKDFLKQVDNSQLDAKDKNIAKNYYRSWLAAKERDRKEANKEFKESKAAQKQKQQEDALNWLYEQERSSGDIAQYMINNHVPNLRAYMYSENSKLLQDNNLRDSWEKTKADLKKARLDPGMYKMSDYTKAWDAHPELDPIERNVVATQAVYREALKGKLDGTAPASNSQHPEWGKQGVRADGTAKGSGWLGIHKMTDGSNRDMSEYSIGVEINGKETDIPTLVPTLTKKELDYLLAGNKPNDAIMEKAVKHAEKRIKEGKSPFASESESPKPKTVTLPDGKKYQDGDIIIKDGKKYRIKVNSKPLSLNDITDQHRQEFRQLQYGAA
jgi:hypothetical protein